MRTGARIGAVGAIAALAGLTLAARAQDVRITAPAPAAAADELQQPLSAQESEVLGRALLFDPAAIASDKPARKLRRPGLADPAGLDVKSADKPDGSSAVAVKQPLIADRPGLASNVGADVNLAAPAPNVYQPGKPLPGRTAGDSGSAAAWASVGMPNVASLDARVDPTGDQGRIGGKLSHSLPVGKALSVTLEDSYAMIENFNPLAPTPGSTATLAAPPPVTAAPPAAAAQVFDNAKSLKVNVLPTGTTFGAGMSSASNDPVTHNTLSADQKLFGPLHVTTSVTDVGQPTENKTISAGFKLNW